MRETSEKAAFYPYLLGIFPIVHLAAANADRMPLRYALLPLALCFFATAVPLFILKRLTGDAAKAALVVAGAIVFFHAYGRVRTVFLGIGGRVPLFRSLSDHAVLWPVFCVLLVAAIVLTLRSKRNLRGSVAPLNVFATAITAIALLPFVRLPFQKATQDDVVRLAVPPQPPDVYYIIMDAYGRKDVLQKYYGFDNAPFLDGLAKRGFVVPERSRSNYLYTTLSLSSSLNLDYLDALRPSSEADTRGWLTKRSPLLGLIETNRVARSFRAAGYRYVVLPSGLSFTNQSRIADVNFGSAFDLREFNSMLGQTTMLAPWFGDQFEQVTAAGLEGLERRLLECPALPGPKFVFAHFLSPHPPYQFNADGTPAARAAPGVLLEWSDHAAYVEQVRYLNAFVLRAVDRLVKESKTPPIVIIQGDHGPALRDETATQSSMEPWGDSLWDSRSGNLSAYYVPPAVRSKIPDDVTPVNAFRIVFREVFGADLPLRPNATYYSERNDVYRLVPVPRKGLE